MKHLNDTECSALRSALQTERNDLQKQLATHGKKQNGEWEPASTSVGEEADQTDVADNIEELINNAPLEDDLQARLHEVEEALARMDEGTYGVCTVCNADIPVDRLEANPAAATCIDCA